MNEILICKNGDLNAEDAISFLIYLASSTQQIIAKSNVESISKITKLILNNIFSTNASEYLKILDQNDKQASIQIVSYVIYISDKWYFQMILLNSLRDARFLKLEDTESNSIISYLLKYIRITKPLSLNLLKTLLYILTKHVKVLNLSISQQILNHMHHVALSPIHGFKQHAQTISKICLNHLSKYERESLCLLKNLPMRHIEMYDVLALVPLNVIHRDHDILVMKAFECFQKNIHNKDGGILYAKVISQYSFIDWKQNIWPLIVNTLKRIDEEGEFFQSLIKYWIPHNVQEYSVDFYNFLKDKDINLKVKAYSLLETVKKGHTSTNDVDKQISMISTNIGTTDIGLRIASTYFKKSLCPNKFEVNIIMNYLFANLNEFLDEDVMKSYKLFFSQLFFYAHCDLAKKCNNLGFYQNTLNRIYKYCCSCLGTDFFEVGVQILKFVLDTLKGSYKKLLLHYKLEKKDFYEDGENNLYKHLKINKKWPFNNELLLWKIEHCFANAGSHSSYLTNLLMEHYKEVIFISTENMENLLQNVEKKLSLRNTETVINYSKVFLHIKNNENEIFIEKILNKLINFGEDIFSIVLYFAIIDNALKLDYEIVEIGTLMNNCLDYISVMVDRKTIKEDYAKVKSFESLIIMLLNSITRNIDLLWPKLDKSNFINNLIKIIECSNMKRPVQASADCLKQVVVKMDNFDEDVDMKIVLLNTTLNSIHGIPSLKLKIRRNPESRLVIHSICSAVKSSNKPLLNWSMSTLLNFISSDKCSDIAIARSLHCLEILVADNTLYNHTLPYIPDIIVNCIELFNRSNWIIRNADLQLAKAIIDRFYGVCLGLCDRPKNVEDLFQLFPQLMPYFFKILSADSLDDRASMVFQFFSESQIKHKTTKFLDYFKIIFMHIIKNYPHQYGKFAVKSYVAVCYFEDIPSVILQIIEYIQRNYKKETSSEHLRSNILTNLVFLMHELFEKYRNSTKPEKLDEIYSYVTNLKSFLRKLPYSPLFDHMLLKVNDAICIKENIKSMTNNRLWLHNNIPYLVINAKSSDMADVLDMLLSSHIAVCFKIKVLSIFVSRFEADCFDSKKLTIILNILFKNAFSSDDNDYLSLCYFKVISLLYQNISKEQFKPEMALVEASPNIYKSLLSVLYVSSKNYDDKVTATLYKSALDVMISSIGINEETNNDIMSTIFYFKHTSDVQIWIKLLKIVFYCSIFYSTYLEAYIFISSVKKRNYTSMLEALHDFLKPETLIEFLKDENQIKIFYNDLIDFYSKAYKDDKSNGYYSIDTDNLIPKQLFGKLLMNVRSKCENVKMNI